MTSNTTKRVGIKVPQRDPELDDSDDEDYDSFSSPLMQTRESKAETERTWNLFQNPPRKEKQRAYEDWGFYQNCIRVLKVFTYFIVFVLVIGSSIISKSAFFVMTSQLEPQANRTLCYGGLDRFVEISLEERAKWTWGLLICLIIPEIGTLIRSLRKFFKQLNTPPKVKALFVPSIVEFLVPCLFETGHAIGLGLFTFYVLPYENVLRGLMLTNSACLIPGILALLSRLASKKSKFWIPQMAIDAVAIIAVIYGIIRWPTAAETIPEPWVFPLAAILTSLGWWENYLPIGFQIGFTSNLDEFQKRLEKTRYTTYLFVCIIKMATFFLTMCVCIWIPGDDLSDYFDTEIFSDTFLVVSTSSISGSFDVQTNGTAILNTILIQVFATYLLYISAKYACKISIQRCSFALPLLLSTPITIISLWGMCREKANDSCYADSLFPSYLYWNCPIEMSDFGSDFTGSPEFGWVGLILFLAQAWIAFHIWFPKWDPLASTEELFTTPMYPSPLTDQSLLMNRKPDDGVPSKVLTQVDLKQKKVDDEGLDEGLFGIGDPRWDKTPKIIACATLWHEIKEEMIAMFKSVFRMDLDNWQRKKFMDCGADERTIGYYEYKTQIFFDDAFKRVYKNNDFKYVINEHVKTMIEAISDACGQIHGEGMEVNPPKRIPTPYGGRLEWILPGETKLTVHLKNKDKIRHRKRWSQVMYMYYLLGHVIAESGVSLERQDDIAENTFLLALDGDIDFQPHSVELLLNLMKKNDHLGAACGRIHPIGSGPMVWYQKFEYAMGHWLQKATEHMIGCVLCSPGCFSMFRAKALMDDCVMKKYTTTASEPRHYVQYDQGEDRWLCTLLLQQGWRVEYCAASDSYTHAPEGFDEFFNQRRRWVPSTMANIMDLLMDARETTEKNDNISMPYIFYQWILMIGGILGPGTIFLMLVGSCSVAFKFSNEVSLIINVIPILLFILVCYFCKAKTQLALAKLLSCLYGLVMIAVLIALLLLVGEDGLLAPSSIFLLAVASTFIIAALIHPLEFTCLVHGILYFITIPSMYLLLIIYSLFNLHDVSWGTREAPVQVPPNQGQDAQMAAAIQQQKGGKKKGTKGRIMTGLKNIAGMDNSDESLDLSAAGLCRLSCCFSRKPRDMEEKVALVQMQQSLENITEHLGLNKVGHKKGSVENAPERQRTIRIEVPGTNKGKHGNNSSSDSDSEDEHNDLFNPIWLDDETLNAVDAQTDFLPKFEIQFWEELIEAYLKPLDEDADQKKKLERELKDLRNKTVGAFFGCNAVFVTAMFLLQMHKDFLYIVWPLGGDFTMYYEVVDSSVTVTEDYLHLEPLGILFIGFYAIVMLVQFLAMFSHRLATFSLIMVATSILRGHENKDLLTKPSASKAKATVKLIKEIQNMEPGLDDKTKLVHGGPTNRGPVMSNLHKTRNEKTQSRTLDMTLANKFNTIVKSPNQMGKMTKYVKDPQAEIKRMSSMLQLRQTVNLETQA